MESLDRAVQAARNSNWVRMNISPAHLEILRRRQVMAVVENERMGVILIPPTERERIEALIQAETFNENLPRGEEEVKVISESENIPDLPAPASSQESKADDEVVIMGEALLKRVVNSKILRELRDSGIAGISLRKSLPQENNPNEINFVWRTGSDLEKNTPEELSFGYEKFSVKDGDYSVLEIPWPKNSAVITDDNGVPVWQILGNVIRILPNPNSSKCARYLIREGIRIYFDKWAIAVGMEISRLKILAERENRISDLVKLGLVRQITQLRKKIKGLHDEIVLQEKVIFNKSRELHELNEVLAGLKDQVEKINTEGYIDRMLKIPEVTEINFPANGVMVAELAPMVARVRKDGSEIAKILLPNYTIEFNFINGEILINAGKPITEHGAKWDHPHVSNGHPCWGTASGNIAKLMSRYDIYNVVILVISFLKSVNANDTYGSNWKKWPVVTEEVKCG